MAEVERAAGHGADLQPLVVSLPGQAARMELVPGAGGVLNRLVLDGREVLAGLGSEAELAENPQYRGAPLFPFPNRLTDGRYRFRGQEHAFPVNEPATQNALHGFLFRQVPEVVASDQSPECASLTLQYQSDGSEPGYPFRATVQFKYWLRGARDLQLEITVHNREDEPIPVGLGWHPYFRLPGPMDEWQLQLPQVERMAIDERMLPTGQWSPYTDFARLSPIGATELDDGFALTGEGERQRASVRLWSEKAGYGLDIWQQRGPRGFDYLQVFTPPGRDGIAVEPMSCAIDAFNNGHGLCALEPRGRFSVVCGVRLIDDPDTTQ